MPIIKTVAGQTLFDLACTAYGNVDAAFALLGDSALATLDLSANLPAGIVLALPETGTLFNRPVLSQLAGATVAAAPVSLVLQSLDPDVQAFLSATQLTAPAQIIALIALVSGLKQQGIWAKSACLYPMVGDTATAHAVNLRQPGTYDLTFYNGPTHDANGVTFDGISQYANTSYSLTSAPSWASSSALAWYDRTDGGVEVNNWVIGVGNTATGDPLFGLYVRRQDGSCALDAGNASAGNRTAATVPTAKGFTVGSIAAASNRRLYKNGILLAGPNTVSDNPTIPVSPVCLGVMNPTAGLSYFANCQCAFASIHPVGLSVTEVAAYNQIVQDFQMALGRNV